MLIDIFNHWWKEKKVRQEFIGKPRKIFNTMLPYINKKQIIIVEGIRRVGKTTLLYQFINHLISVKKINPFYIFYYSFDEETRDINELFDYYKTHILKSNFFKKNKIYIFFDEIQKLKNWADKIKIFYDLYPNIKFFLSGSSTLELLKGSKESLAGRTFYFKIEPLDFKEFLLFKNIKIDKERIELYKNDIKLELNNYLKTSGFIEVINEKNDKIINKYFKEGLLERIIYRDIPNIFPINEPDLLLRLIKIISNLPGMMIDYKSLGNDLKRDPRTIAQYLNYLKMTYILDSVYNFSKNILTSEKKLKKFYLSYPAFSLSFIQFFSEKEPLLFENLIFSILKPSFFFRTADKREVDFIIVDNQENITPVEVKFKQNISKKDISGLYFFLNKFNCKNGLIITPDFEKTVKENGHTIRFIPLYKYIFTL